MLHPVILSAEREEMGYWRFRLKDQQCVEWDASLNSFAGASVDDLADAFDGHRCCLQHIW